MPKSVLLAGALGLVLGALAPAQALARDHDMGRAAAELSNPKNQRAVAGMVEAMSEMLLSVKVAPLAKAMEQMGDRDAARSIPKNATLADMAGPEARRMPRELSRRVPQMMGAMAGMTEVMQAMLPQLEAMAEKMKHALPDEATPLPDDNG